MTSRNGIRLSTVFATVSVILTLAWAALLIFGHGAAWFKVLGLAACVGLLVVNLRLRRIWSRV